MLPFNVTSTIEAARSEIVVLLYFGVMLWGKVLFSFGWREKFYS